MISQRKLVFLRDWRPRRASVIDFAGFLEESARAAEILDDVAPQEERHAAAHA
jgi:hypothetical protein